MERKLKQTLLAIVTIVIALNALSLSIKFIEDIPDSSYSELINMIENEPQKITSIKVNDKKNRVSFTFLNQKNKKIRKVTQLTDSKSFVDFLTKQQSSNDKLKCDIEIDSFLNFIDLFIIVSLAVVVGTLIMNLHDGEKNNSTNSRKTSKDSSIFQLSLGAITAKDFQDDIKSHIVKNEKMRYSDVAGMRYVKESMFEVAFGILNTDEYMENGAKIPSGILLKGKPGTGKTILARALAGELKIPFIQYSATEMLNQFVGNSEGKVRAIFDYAKENSPCIIFFDEIDAIATSRSKNTQRHENTLLIQLLTCLDGFETRDGVIFIAATNYPDALDEAITRPGRFDRIINIDLPNLEEREAILKVHARNKKLSEEVDLREIARSTPGYSGAYLENILNEAVLLQIKNGHCCILAEDINEAIRTVLFGNKSDSNRSIAENHVTAIHELGHAITSRKEIREISIVPREHMGGYTWFIGEDMSYISASKIKEEIICDLGGRAAEDVLIGDISNGAEHDMNHAWKMAQEYIIKYGMSETLGPVSFGISNETDEQTKSIVFEETKKMIFEAYNEAKKIITENKNRIEKISVILEEKEIISGNDFDTMLEEKNYKL